MPKELQDTQLAYAHSVFAYEASADIYNIKKQWLYDTCVSFHMTADRSLFITYKEVNSSDGIHDAQGGTGKPIGMGTVVIQTGDAILKLEDVRHLPTLKTNLISAILLEQQGFQVEKSKSSPSFYTIGTPDGDTVIATVMTGPNIYRIETGKRCEESKDTYAYSAVTVSNISTRSTVLNEKNEIQYNLANNTKLASETLTLSEWHQRLGHLNQADILKLAKDVHTGIKIKGSKSLPFCEVCKQA
jgi:GAG-pre-integrase domain